jgi:hypothetical protein
MSSTGVRVIDLTSRLGSQALEQVGMALAPSETLKVIALGGPGTPAIEWTRPGHPHDDFLGDAGPRALVLVVGPGSVRETETLLSRALEAQVPCIRIFVLPSAIVEELTLKPMAAAHPATAHLYRLPDSSPETLWFVLIEEFDKLSSLYGLASLQPLYPSTKDNMSTNLKQSMDTAMSIDGALAAALVDYRSGMCLAQAGSGLNLDLAAAGNSQVVKAKLQTMESLGLRKGIEDILITLGDQYHLIRLVPNNAGLFLYLVLDKAKGNLALARYKLTDVERTLKI